MNLPIIFRFFSQIFRFNLFEVSVMPCKSYHNRFIFDWESFHLGARILKAMKENGSPQPEFDSDDDRSYYIVRLPVHPNAEQLREQATTEATTEVKRMLAVCAGEHTRQELKEMLGLKNDELFRKSYIKPGLEAGVIEMTQPDSPKSPTQKYRLTSKGRKLLEIS